jgi:GT2 family glycosyltransferase
LKVYIVILNYNNWQDATECIESLLALDYKNFTVILVDNCSPNQSEKALKDWIIAHPTLQKSWAELNEESDIELVKNNQILFIQSGKNGGFAYGNNVALRYILSENAYVWLLNGDVVVAKDTLTHLVEYAPKTTQQIFSVGSLIYNYYQPQQLLMYGGSSINSKNGMVRPVLSAKELDKLDYIHGGSLFTNTATLQKVGLLPEEYFLYWEETDWCYQLKQKGGLLLVCESAVIYDKVGGSIGRGYWAEYYYTLNSLRFHQKYKIGNIKYFIKYNYFRLLKKIVSGKWQRAKGVLTAIHHFQKKYRENNYH